MVNIGSQMARRRHKRYRGDTQDRGDDGGGSLIDALAELTVWLLRLIAAGLARAVRWAWGRMFVHSLPGPPPVPAGQARRDAHDRVSPPQLPPPSSRLAPLPPLSHSAESAPPAPAPLPYRRAARLLSRGEWAFWHPLYHAVKGEYRIFCKVRLADVVGAPGQYRQERRWFRKIRAYHVDFVICEPRTTAPLLIIELDDRSHKRPQRRDRDLFKEQVLAAAGLPILRVQAQQAYDPTELRTTIDRLIGNAERPARRS